MLIASVSTNIYIRSQIHMKQHGDGHINEEHGNNDEDSRPNGIEARDERSQQNNGFDDDALQDDKDMKLDEDIHLDEMDPAGESEEPDNNEDVDQNEFPDESNSHTNESEEMPDEEVKDDAENSDKAKPMGAGGDASPNYQPEEGEESVEENNSTYSVDDTSKNDLKDTAIKQKNFGVQSKNGKESINQDNDDEMEDFTENGVGSETTTGQEGQEAERGTCSGGTNDSTGSIGQGAMEQGSMDKSRAKPRLDHPNPFRSPGDADKFWHNRLEMIEDKAGDEEFDESHFEEYDEKNADPKAQPYEFTQKGQDSTTQVLGAAVEEFAHDLDMRQMEEKEDNEFLQEQKDNAKDDRQSGNIEKNESLKPALNQKDTSSIATHTESEKLNDNSLPVEGEVTNDDNDDDESNMNAELDVMSTCLSEKGDDTEVESEESEVKNKVVSDLAQLRLRQEDVEDGCELVSRYDLMEAYSHSAEDMTVDRVMEGRSKWVQLNFETLSISRRLCEKLRLVMEPLVASKLRGDYRSGKRINMKRIIGYIASGYRKDKIWLRRTKPSKRDYRVLLAVDNSESMSKTGAGGMALLALAALANGMSQLEVGELGVASFGETMRLLHPFNAPFTVESGANIACNLNFDEKRTRTALCIENVITALEHAGGGIHSSLQLVFIISDGRIERDSRSKMRRLVREMAERNMLCVMIIIENTLRDSLSSSSSTTKKQNSIMNMKEATFENGMPKLVHFMDDYPFPYYMVLEDMSSLPEVLGDALRQWFEVLAQMTG
jgi:midasin